MHLSWYYHVLIQCTITDMLDMLFLYALFFLCYLFHNHLKRSHYSIRSTMNTDAATSSYNAFYIVGL